MPYPRSTSVLCLLALAGLAGCQVGLQRSGERSGESGDITAPLRPPTDSPVLAWGSLALDDGRAMVVASAVAHEEGVLLLVTVSFVTPENLVEVRQSARIRRGGTREPLQVGHGRWECQILPEGGVWTREPGQALVITATPVQEATEHPASGAEISLLHASSGKRPSKRPSRE